MDAKLLLEKGGEDGEGLVVPVLISACSSDRQRFSISLGPLLGAALASALAPAFSFAAGGGLMSMGSSLAVVPVADDEGWRRSGGGWVWSLWLSMEPRPLDPAVAALAGVTSFFLTPELGRGGKF